MAARYDGDPNVAFIDVGSYGLWGEGHTFFSSRVPSDEALPILKKHMDLYAKRFPRTLLAVNDDFAGSETSGAHLPETDYGLAKGMTLRDDSIMYDFDGSRARTLYSAGLGRVDSVPVRTRVGRWRIREDDLAIHVGHWDESDGYYYVRPGLLRRYLRWNGRHWVPVAAEMHHRRTPSRGACSASAGLGSWAGHARSLGRRPRVGESIGMI